MACFAPLHGYRGRTVGRSGKRPIVFNPREGFGDLPVTVPCGQCIGCRLERSRQWAIRCLHEASLYEDNCFITLTYDDEHLPPFGSLDPRAFPLFMKRLRKRFGGRRVRYFQCGEYGALLGRPHYHGLLFGFDFVDKVAWTERGGLPVFRSAALEAAWPFGLSEIGSVTFESAAYVARYVTKKVTGEDAEEHYTVVSESSGEIGKRVPEFSTMSRRPGIGRPWLEKYLCEVYPEDGVVVRGKLMKPPRFYDGQFELVDPVGARAVRVSRCRARRREDEVEDRLRVRETCARARLSLQERSMER